MKIQKEDLQSVKKSLEKLNLSLGTASNSFIVFPIDKEMVKTIDGMEFISSLSVQTSKAAITEPVLFIKKSDTDSANLAVELGFVDLTYSKKFQFDVLCELTGNKVPKKLLDADCFLINREYLTISFKI